MLEDLKVGMEIFHNGRPMELLYRIAIVNKKHRSEVWKCRPLFVQGPDFVEQFLDGDVYCHLHTEIKHQFS